MHWTERSRAVARIGAELHERGWDIHGYTKDRSDPMTDYYAPASWKGVATHPDHPDVVVCVDVSSYLVRDKSGRGDWPTFHATPHGKTWHVERDGEVVKTGTGLQRCARWGEEGQAAVERLVERSKPSSLETTQALDRWPPPARAIPSNTTAPGRGCDSTASPLKPSARR
jgi:hypothetical protein